MKLLLTVLTLTHFLTGLALANDGHCKIDFKISETGKVTGSTNSRDLQVDSNYSLFSTEDDDGFISQTIILNKILNDNRGLSSPLVTTEDLHVLMKATERAISYSTSERVLKNPKLKPADKLNLNKVAEYNKRFQETLRKMRQSHKFDAQEFKRWRLFMEEQRFEHYFTLYGESKTPSTRGVINLCGAYPVSIPDCCRHKIAELNNVLSMSLCSENFATGEKVSNIFPAGGSKCAEYSISVTGPGNTDSNTPRSMPAPINTTKQ